eukprot:3406068-Pleurochrysis_carterae.AAC.1
MPSNSPSAIMAFGTSMATVSAFVDPHRPPRCTPSYVPARVSTSEGLRPPSSFTASLKSTSVVSTPSTSARTSSRTAGS